MNKNIIEMNNIIKSFYIGTLNNVVLKDTVFAKAPKTKGANLNLGACNEKYELLQQQNHFLLSS